MLNRFLLATAAMCICFTSGFAQTVVFDNIAGLTFDNVAINDVSATIGGETVDDFLLTATTRITAINFSGTYVPDLFGGDSSVAATDDNFDIRIYRSNIGPAGQPIPGNLEAFFPVGNGVNRVAAGVLPVGSQGADLAVFDFSADIDFVADAGVNYFVSVLNNTLTDSDNFNQLVVSSGGNAFTDLSPGSGNFLAQPFVTDFQLIGVLVVPEPSSVALLAFGFAGFSALRRR